MTKEEIKLQSKITKQNEQILELKEKLKTKPKKENPLFKTKFATSKITLHITHVIVISVVIFIIYMCCKYLYNEPVYLSGVLGALATNVFISLNLTTKYYIDKAKLDSEYKTKQQMYELMMKYGEKATKAFENKEMSLEGVKVFKLLTTEREVNLSFQNDDGGFNVVDDNRFMTQNPNINSNTENVLENTQNTKSDISNIDNEGR